MLFRSISGLPVIGSVSEAVTEAQTVLRRKQLMLYAGGLGGLGVAWLGLVAVEFIQRGLAA